jgi:hypothetical protein
MNNALRPPYPLRFTTYGSKFTQCALFTRSEPLDRGGGPAHRRLCYTAGGRTLSSVVPQGVTKEDARS